LASAARGPVVLSLESRFVNEVGCSILSYDLGRISN
jgi:hypothetical protein